MDRWMQRGQRDMHPLSYLSKVSKEKILRKCDIQFAFSRTEGKRKKEVGKEK